MDKENTNCITGSTDTSFSNQWSTPQRIQVIELQDSIEIIYKETSNVIYTHSVYPSTDPEERIFKIIFSCKGGKWHKSDRIYGEIVSSTKESYEFEE